MGCGGRERQGARKRRKGQEWCGAGIFPALKRSWGHSTLVVVCVGLLWVAGRLPGCYVPPLWPFHKAAAFRRREAPSEKEQREMTALAGRLAALNRRWSPSPFPLRYLAIGLGSGLLLVSGESQLALIYNKPPQLFGLLSCVALFAGMAILLLAALAVQPPEALRRLAVRLRLPLVAITVLLATLWLLFFIGTTYSALGQPPK